MNIISPTVPSGNTLSWMNNLCNSCSSSWRELHRQSQVYWMILVVHLAVQCWDACCGPWEASYLSNVEVGCRRLMSESPFDTRLLPGAINTDRGPSSSSPYSFSFLATAFQSIQVSFKGCALFLPNFPDTERWQIENVKGAPGDLHSPPSVCFPLYRQQCEKCVGCTVQLISIT